MGFEHLKDEGETREEVIPGEITFTKDGVDYNLAAFKSGRALQLVFADATSGDRPYSVGRFLFVAPNADGTITLDFNRAVLPPCAFSYDFNCPLPPKQNRFAVRDRGGREERAEERRLPAARLGQWHPGTCSPRAPHPRPIGERRRHGHPRRRIGRAGRRRCRRLSSAPHDGVRWVWDDTTRWYPALLAAGRAGRALPRPAPQPPDPAELGPDRRLGARASHRRTAGMRLSAPSPEPDGAVRPRRAASSSTRSASSRRSKPRSPAPPTRAGSAACSPPSRPAR